MSQIREEAIMSAVVDEGRTKDRTMTRLAGLLEDAAVVALVFSFVAVVAALIVAALLV